MSEVDDMLSSENRAVIWPAIVVVSLFLPWVRVAGLLSLQVNGIDIDVGPVILILAIAIGGSWIYEDGKYRVLGWLGGGTLMGVLVLLAIWNIQSSISQYQAETQGNIFADSVAINIGSGAYLALIATAAIIFVGYRRYNSEDQTESSAVETRDIDATQDESDSIEKTEG